SRGNTIWNGNPANRSRISPVLPGLRVAISNFIAGGARISRAAQPVNESRGRLALDEGNANHVTAPRFHVTGTYDLVVLVVGAFAKEVRSECADQRQWGVVIEQDDAIHARHGREPSRPFRRRYEGTAGTFAEPAHRGIAVHADEEGRTQRSRL